MIQNLKKEIHGLKFELDDRVLYIEKRNANFLYLKKKVVNLSNLTRQILKEKLKIHYQYEESSRLVK